MIRSKYCLTNTETHTQAELHQIYLVTRLIEPEVCWWLPKAIRQGGACDGTFHQLCFDPVSFIAETLNDFKPGNYILYLFVYWRCKMYHRSAPDKDQDPPDIHVTMNDVRSPWGWAEPRQVKPGQQVMSPGEGADIITDQWSMKSELWCIPQKWMELHYWLDWLHIVEALNKIITGKNESKMLKHLSIQHKLIFTYQSWGFGDVNTWWPIRVTLTLDCCSDNMGHNDRAALRSLDFIEKLILLLNKELTMKIKVSGLNLWNVPKWDDLKKNPQTQITDLK